MKLPGITYAKKGFLVILGFLAAHVARAQAFDYQDESPGQGGLRLDYGITFGGYLANRGTASYYNGSTPFNLISGQTKLEYIFTNIHYRETIREQVGNYPFSLPANPYPDRMSYRPSVMIGLFGTGYLSRSLGIIGEFNFARLKTQDRFVLNVIRNPMGLPDENILLVPIWGVEERYDIRLGIQHTILSDDTQVQPFFELGANMTNTLVKENSIRVGSSTFPMHQPQSSLYFQERDFGVGFGAFAGVGARLAVNQSYSLWVGYSANMGKVNLGNNKRFLLQHSVFARLSLAGVL